MNNRENKSVIIWASLSLIVFLSFSFIIINYIYPNILNIEKDKEIFLEKLNSYDTLDQKWFDINDFKKLNTFYWSSKKIQGKDTYKDKELYELLNNDFYKKVYDEIDDSFYNNSLYDWSYSDFSNSEGNFENYLSELDKRLGELKDSENFNDKKGNISIVLPKYSSFTEFNSEESLTDLEFINNIEWLLKRFNIKTTSSIWIKNLVSVDSDVISEDDHIYYIPLDLDVVWSKIWIINFIEYLKKSWSVAFDNNDFNFNESNWLISQLAEVSSFSIDKYIDSSLDKRFWNNESLIRFLNNTGQYNDIIKANLSLKFYISWIWSEKIISEINSIIWDNISKTKQDQYWNFIKNEETWEYEQELLHYNYSNISRVVKKLNWNKEVKKNAYYSKKVNNIFLYLNNTKLKKDFVEIKKELKKTQDLDSIYLRVLEYKDIFSKIDKEVFFIVSSLWIDRNDVYSKNYVFK